jgi:hypothetical protein
VDIKNTENGVKTTKLRLKQVLGPICKEFLGLRVKTEENRTNL